MTSEQVQIVDQGLSLIYDFMMLDLSPIQQKRLIAKIKELEKTRTNEFVIYANNIWKKNKRYYEAIRFLKLLTVMEGFDKTKILGDIFSALETIDNCASNTQYLAACRYVSKVITAADIPKKPRCRTG